MTTLDRILNKVSRIDVDAATYIRKMYDEGRIPEENIVDSPRAITYLFTWCRQPQGERYWLNIYNKYYNLPNTTKLGNEL